MRLDSSGAVIDSIPIPLESQSPPVVSTTPSGPRYPFTVSVRSALSPLGYLVSGSNDRYSIYRPLPDGRILEIDRSYVPVPITEAERREWHAWWDWLGERAAGHGNGGRIEVPDGAKPAIRDLYVDADGRIWVSRYVEARFVETDDRSGAGEGDMPEFQWREPSVWDVLDPRGRFLGTIRAPEGVLVAARGRAIWMIETGRLDENYLVRYRIEGR